VRNTEVAFEMHFIMIITQAEDGAASLGIVAQDEKVVSGLRDAVAKLHKVTTLGHGCHE